MADKAQEARERRTAGRERRRSRVAEQFEEMDESARGQTEAPAQNGQVAQTAAKVVGSAVAAALLGAAAAAAKGLIERKRADEEQTEEPRAEADRAGEDTASAEAQAEEEEPRSEPDRAGEDTASAEPQAQEEQDEFSPEASDQQEEEEPSEGAGAEQEQRARQEPVQGASEGEAAEVVTRARRQLEGLLGAEPERVSGLTRENGGWSVMLEVVEVARIPESTDVLGTYELRLDDELNVVSVDRRRRYRRSQVDEAS
jgi:hypothetical protein